MIRESVLFDDSCETAMSRSKASPRAASAGSMVIDRWYRPPSSCTPAPLPAPITAPIRVGVLGRDRLADHHRDVTGRLLLVAGVPLVGRRDLGPQSGLLLGRGGAGQVGAGLAFQGDLHRRIGRQVA